MILLLIILLVITAFSSSEMDTIKHPNARRTPLIDKKLFKKLLGEKKYQSFRKNWYMANNWKGHTYFKKTIGAMFIDGWHWFKFWRVWSFSSIVGMLLILTYTPFFNILWSLPLGIVVTFIHGALFEVFYQDIIGI